MTIPTGPWSDVSRWMRAVRLPVVCLVLVDVSLGTPAPGLTGRHLVLLVGMVAAAVAWLAWLQPEQVDARVVLAVLVIGVVGGCLATVASPNSGALVLPAVIAMLAGATVLPWQAAGVAALGIITLAAGGLVITATGAFVLSGSLAIVGGLAAGLWRRQYRLRAEEAEQLAVQTRRAEGEHVRVQVLDERARIAREIHDILGHTLGGLVIQLDAAEAVLEGDHDRDRLGQLVAGARRLAADGLEETRQAVAALRADPVAMPEALAALVASTGTSGGIGSSDGVGPVRHEVIGDSRQLAPEVGLAIYRTAQEALTNARKHAPHSPIDMVLSFEAGATVLRVTNAAPDETSVTRSNLAGTGGGYGLSGLKERAELLGGTLDAGPKEDSWVVELRLPV